MKIYIFILLFISFIISTSSSGSFGSSSSDNSGPLNYYFSIDGSDDNDGTLEKPFYSICKLTEIIYSIPSNLNLNSSINAFVEYGEYNLNNCTLDLNNSSNINNILIKSIINNNNNNNSNNNNFNIYNSNSNDIINKPVFNNISILISNVNLIINNIYILNKDSLFDRNWITIVNSTVLITNGSVIEFDEELYVELQYPILNSLIQVEFGSSLRNLNLLFNQENFQVLAGITSYLGYQSGSTLENCNIIGYNLEINIINSSVIDSTSVVQNNTFTFMNSKFKMTGKINPILNNYILFAVSNNGSLIVQDCVFDILPSAAFINFANSLSFGNMNFTNIIISGLGFFDSIFKCFRSSLSLNNITIIDSHGSTLVDSTYSVLNIQDVSVKQSAFNFIELNGPSDIYLYNIQIDCSTSTSFNSIISMSQSDEIYNTERSNITIKDLSVDCAGSFEFRNADFYCIDIHFSQVRIPNVFGVSLNSSGIFNNITVSYTVSGFYSSLKNYFFIVDQQSSVEITSSTFQDTSSILLSNGNSSILISNSSFKKASSNSLYFLINNSNLSIYNSNFTDLFSMNTGFMNINNSYASLDNIGMNNLHFYGGSLISTVNSEIYISNLEMNYCMSFINILAFYNSKVLLQNALFFENSGGIGQFIPVGYNNIYRYMMILVYESTSKLENLEFQNNNFKPLISSTNSKFTSINQVNLQNNSGIFFSSDNSDSKISNIYYINNKITNNYFMLFKESTGNMSSIYVSGNIFSELFLSVECSNISIESFNFQNNSVLNIQSYTSSTNGGFFSISNSSSITFINSIFQNNSLTTYGYFDIFDSTISFYNSTFDSNNADNSMLDGSLPLIYYTRSNLLFKNSVFSNNLANSLINAELSYSMIVDHSSFTNNSLYENSLIMFRPYYVDSSYFQVDNSIFTNNTGTGTNTDFSILNLDDYDGCNTTFLSNFSSFMNNTITYNNLPRGVITTTTFPFTSNTTFIEINNNIKDNFLPNSQIFTSYFKYMIFNNSYINNDLETEVNVKLSIRTTFYYYFEDYYGSVYQDMNGQVEFIITSLTNSSIEPEEIVSNVAAGKGSFIYTFNTEIGSLYQVVAPIYGKPFHAQFLVNVEGCPEYQYEIENNKTCIYCDTGYSFSSYKGYCIKCPNSYLSCTQSSLTAFNNHYVVDNDAALVYQCYYGSMCLPNNECTSKYYTGDLCNFCVDKNQNSVSSKNGIHCCSKFNSNLIIPVILIFTLFGLVLSFIKHLQISGVACSIVLFLQINSVSFFSYKGLYILPLFKVSWDLIDDICIFKNLNYLYKTGFSFIIIIYLIIIGYSDITLFIIQLYYKKKTKLLGRINRTKKRTINIKYPILLERILNFRERDRDRIIVKWNLFLLLFIPVIFNSTIMLISKEITTKHSGLIKYSIVDFSVLYLKSPFYQFISILGIIFIIVSSLIILIFCFKLNNIINNNSISINDDNSTTINNNKIIYKSLIKISAIFNKSLYGAYFLGWDFVVLFKSTLIIIFSVTLLFNSKIYLPVILLIQMIYTTFYIIVQPSKIRKIHQSNNLLNLFQLIIYLIANSPIFINNSLYNQGIIICTLTLASIIIYVFYYLYLKKK